MASKTFVSLSDCSLHSNSAGDAGAIAVEENAHFTARACRFRGNQAVDKQGSGGAINVEAYSSLELADSSFSADDAARGAGIFARPSSQVSIANTSFSDYLAGGRSGAVILIMDDSSSHHLLDDDDDDDDEISPLRLIDGVTFDNLGVPAVSGTRVAIANCEGLRTADFDGVVVVDCAAAGAVCPAQHCRDDVAEVGVLCQCDVAGAPSTATRCADTAQMDVYIPAEHRSTFVLRKPSSESNEIALVNGGPQALEWRSTGATQQSVVVWQLDPAQSTVPAASTQVLKLTATSMNLQARAEPYFFNVTLSSDNVCDCDEERAITLSCLVFVSAALDPAKSSVALVRAAQIVAGEEVRFYITPRDAYGFAILDQHELLFVAILANDEFDIDCSVAFDPHYQFSGSCSLPFGVSSHPAVGDFELAVYYYSSESPTNLLGGGTTKFRVHHCPEEFYASRGAASCEVCPAERVKCSKNLTIEKLDLRPGNYRLNDGILAEYIRSCPLPRACKGGVEPGDASCAHGHTSTLCSRCAQDFFRAGDACVSCSSSKRAASSWGWFVVTIAAIAAAVAWLSRRKPTRAAQRAAICMENLRASSGDAPKIIFAGAQILAAYSNLATDALPPNLRSFLQSLDFTSFDVVSATTLPCWDTRLGFFGSKLVFSTCTPAVCISAMWLVHLLRRARVLPAQNRADTTGWSLLVMYLVLPSCTKVIFSAFQCDDDFGESGTSFLYADYGVECTSDEYNGFIRPWGERARAPRRARRSGPTTRPPHPPRSGLQRRDLPHRRQPLLRDRPLA